MIRQHFYTSLRSPAPTSTSCTLPFYAWTWSGASCLFMQVSCCLCFISYLWGWTIAELGAFLNINLFSWTPLLSRVVSHGILQNRSLKNLKSAHLKSRVTVLLFALVSPHVILTSTSYGHCSHGCSAFHFPDKFFHACKCQVQLGAFIVDSSINYVKKLSSVHSRHLLDLVSCCVVPPADIRETEPMRTRAYECEASCSCLKKASSTCSWSGRL